MPNSPTENLLSTVEAAKIAHCTSGYITKLCRSGKLPGTRIGKEWYVDPSVLSKYLQNVDEQKEIRRKELSQSREQEYRSSLLSTDQAALLAGVTSGYISKLARSGKLPATKNGNGWSVKPADLQTYLATVEEEKRIAADGLSKKREAEYRTHQSVAGLTPIPSRPIPVPASREFFRSSVRIFAILVFFLTGFALYISSSQDQSAVSPFLANAPKVDTVSRANAQADEAMYSTQPAAVMVATLDSANTPFDFARVTALYTYETINNLYFGTGRALLSILTQGGNHFLALLSNHPLSNAQSTSANTPSAPTQYITQNITNNNTTQNTTNNTNQYYSNSSTRASGPIATTVAPDGATVGYVDASINRLQSFVLKQVDSLAQSQENTTNSGGSSGSNSGTNTSPGITDTTGDWSGTLDGLTGPQYLANSFSTSSAAYFLAQQNVGQSFSTSSSDSWFSTKTTSDLVEGTNLYYTDARARSAITSTVPGLNYATSTGTLSLSPGYTIPLTASTTDWNNAFLNRATGVSTTTANTWSALQTFNAGITTAGTVTLGSLSGVLHAVNGVVSASTIALGSDVSGILPVSNGGTGSTTLTGILKGNGTGGIQTAIAGIDYENPLTFSSPLSRTGNTISLNTSGDWSGTFDGHAGSYYLDRANQTGTQTASTISDLTSVVHNLFSSAATGLSYDASTGIFSFTAGYSIPTTASQSNWNTAFADRITSATAPLSIVGNVISIAQANASIDGYLSSADWNTFNGKFATTSTNFYLSTKTTDNLAEGTNNLYWTNGRFDTRLSATTSLPNITTLANLGTVSTTLTGVLHSVAGILSAGNVLLGSEVSGTLGVANGGTGSTTLTGILKGNGTGGILTAVQGVDYQAPGSYITALTGDISASGPGSAVATLATVNSNVGSFGGASTVPTFTVNGKGLITAAGSVAVVAPAGTLSGTTLASNVVTSSLTTLGTLTSLNVSGLATLGSIIDSAVTGNTLLYSNGTKQDSSVTLPSYITLTAGTLAISALPNAQLANSTISGISLGGTLATLTFGTHLTSGASSYNGSTVATITTDATSANTPGTIVARDGSGNFTAGTITGSLNGTASTVVTDANLTGDVTSVGNATTLVTVNSNVGSFGGATSVPTFTVNGKGLITAAGSIAVVAPAGTLSGTTLASNVVTSSLTSVGTLGTLGVSGTATAGNVVDTGVTANSLIYANGSQQLASAIIGNGLTLTSGTLAVSTTSIASGFFQQGGNAFGTTATLGTTDANQLNFITSNTPRLSITSAGSVGIGTTTPGSLLSIGNTGGINFSLATSTFSTTGGINISSGCYAVNGVCIGSNSVGAGTTGQFPYYAANGSSVTATSSLFLSPSGNIGVNTASPTNTLSVNGTANFSGNVAIGTTVDPSTQLNILSPGFAFQQIKSSDPTNRSEIEVANSSGSALFLEQYGGSASGSFAGIPFANLTYVSGGSSNFMLSYGSQALEFVNGTSETARLTGAGSFGLGTTNPLSKLDVNGSVAIGSYAGVNAAPTNGLIISGSIGIGTTSPSSKLTIDGSVFIEGSNNYLNFGTTTGSSGYGLRDNSGSLEFKNLNGAWAGLANLTGMTVYSTQSGSTNSTYTVPTGVNVAQVVVELWGGGGGGGGGSTDTPGTTCPPGNVKGGSGGTYAKRTLTPSNISGTVTITVGAGGTGAGPGCNSSDGVGGGQTSFGSLVTVIGGQGGPATNGVFQSGNGTTGGADFSTTGAAGTATAGGAAPNGSVSGGTGGTTFGASGNVYGGGGAPGNSTAYGGAASTGGAGAVGGYVITTYIYSAAGASIGTAGQLPFYGTGGSSLTATSSIFLSPSGNVGIGTTTPLANLTVSKDQNSQTYESITNYNAGSSAGTLLVLGNDKSPLTGQFFVNSSTNTGAAGANSVNINNFSSTGNLALETNNGNVRLSIASNGLIGIGTGANVGGWSGNAQLGVTGAGTALSSWGISADILNGGIGGAAIMADTMTTSASLMYMYYNHATQVGSITTNGSSVQYNTTSDRRLKENITPTTAGLATLMQIPVDDFNFISDPDSHQQGYIAQDLYNYYPEAVHVGGDDPATNPWSVDYGRLTPLIMSSVQQLANGYSLNNTSASSTVASWYEGVTAPAISVDAVGNVGIGTGSASSTTLSSKFVVNGDASVLGTVYGNNFVATGDGANFARMYGSIAVGTTTAASVLSTDGQSVDVYKLATFALSGVQQLEEQQTALASTTDTISNQLNSLTTRVSALEAGAAAATASLESASSTESVLSMTQDVAAAFQALGLTLQNGISSIEQVIIGHLTVGTHYKPSGVTLFDTATGNPYCLSITNGSQQVTPGPCPMIDLTSQLNQQASSTPSGASGTNGNGEATSTPGTIGTSTPPDISSSTPPTVSSDTTPPVVTLVGNAAINLNQNDAWIDPGATATDDADGDLTSSIVVTGTVDTSTPGTYTLQYSATDAAGNIGSVSRMVVVAATPDVAPLTPPAPSP